MSATPRTSLRTAHTVLVLAALLPLAYIASELIRGTPLNPAQYLQRGTGRWTLRLLLLTLCVTPLRALTSWQGIAPLRRTLGLLTFAYAVLHMLTYTVFDMGLDFDDIGFDIRKRPAVLFGALTFCLLVPLAATSTRRAQQRLGGRAWKRLHRLIHVASISAVSHF